MKTEFPGYEAGLKELEEILKKLEEGDVNMDDISSLVKRASFLIENCKLKLRNIEQELGENFKEE